MATTVFLSLLGRTPTKVSHSASCTRYPTTQGTSDKAWYAEESSRSPTSVFPQSYHFPPCNHFTLCLHLYDPPAQHANITWAPASPATQLLPPRADVFPRIISPSSAGVSSQPPVTELLRSPSQGKHLSTTTEQLSRQNLGQMIARMKSHQQQLLALIAIAPHWSAVHSGSFWVTTYIWEKKHQKPSSYG